jgi:two-component system response regulator HydG
VAEGTFREDLYYRLDVVSVALPPLRERRGDVPLLAMHFLKRYADKHNKAVVGIEQPALDALIAADFPGNVRELENAVERAVVLCPADHLRRDDLPAHLQTGGTRDDVSADPLSFRVGTTMVQLERAAIDATLRYAEGDKKLAAKLLGLSLRTLYRRLEERDADDGAAVADDEGD